MDAARVLQWYPEALRGRLQPHPGGFSGASIWKLDVVTGSFCLRAAASGESRDHLHERHRLMRLARAVGLTFVPVVLPTQRGECFIEQDGRFWELMDWLPGIADFAAAPSEARLRAAVTALAHLHLAWRKIDSTTACCPAILRRREALPRWEAFSRTVSRWDIHPRLASIVTRWMPHVPELLHDLTFPVRVQPCLRDVWHDHLLFDGDRLTGLIDYAAVGIDSIAVDLARMLGSLIGDDEPGWRLALRTYRAIAPLSNEEEILARRLDRAGVIVALANWLRRLHENSLSSDEKARKRIETLLTRVATW